ncbi:MAG: ATP-binding protein [Deltaproteobacteria bacterium]|jgi:uncharacterized protein|nr:ATP-binding protein [Deltaproteobacteria bacterium]MBT4268734.1 ATP-binding protein [Deltaproteobacteria bacterium]MBT4637559.1 ATP-binding protein [Deltaproteobacteria bacterium]MBT6612990.1 ATP-binding protein [Deltaproteobacteria bacterium]MBT7710097.1 ATP-binding protein [Deltaproteobacteria bacterium]
MILNRHINRFAFSEEFGRQMRFIVGPRQSGKTTSTEQFLKENNCQKLYYNWDKRSIRTQYIVDNYFYLKDLLNVKPTGHKRWLCMDEIHKYPKWKDVLKDFFDSHGSENGFIITGSARLDMMRQSGDSLAGRYFTFRLNPVTLAELLGRAFQPPTETAEEWIKKRLGSVEYHEQELISLLEFSGFPEPMLSGSKRFHNKWRDDYIDRLVKEDIRDLTKIRELENIATLVQFLPSKVSSPLSINSLTRDMKISFATIANYLKTLELGYLVFRIPPYTKNIARSLTKENKLYFFDWTRIPTPAHRFENYLAVELKSLLESWVDAGYGNYELCFIRDRDGKETDFLILKESQPWLLIEAKTSKSTIEYHHLKNREVLSRIPFIQIVRENNVAEKREDGVYQLSASRFFG